MWRQPTAERLSLRRAIRRQFELLLQQFYRRRVAEGTPQRFVGILSDPGQMEQNCSTHDRWPYETRCADCDDLSAVRAALAVVKVVTSDRAVDLPQRS